VKYSSSKDVDRLVRNYVRRDWVFRRGSKHGRMSPPTCVKFVAIPGTPSDHRTLANLRRDIARVERAWQAWPATALRGAP